jgi:hypothetical protein
MLEPEPWSLMRVKKDVAHSGSCFHFSAMQTRSLHSVRSVLCLLLCASVLGAAGCSRREREDAQARVKDAYEETKAAVVSAWGRAKAFTFEQRDKFTAHAKELSSNMDAQLSKLRAEAADEKASESRRAAWAELKNAEADYKQKVAALGTASADTWESAKQNVIAAWDRLQVAYYRARAK